MMATDTLANSSALVMVLEAPREASLHECYDADELFLLPDQILSVDTASFCVDMASVAPSLFATLALNTRDDQESNPNSLESTDESTGSARSNASPWASWKLLRASNGCKTLWLCDTGSTEAVLDKPSSKSSSSSSSSSDINSSVINVDSNGKKKRATSTDLDVRNHSSLGRNHASNLGRSRLSKRGTLEDAARRARESQEHERRRKLDELKKHAEAAQRFREQQERDREHHLASIRLRKQSRLVAVQERRRSLEEAEQQRRLSLQRRAIERDARIKERRKERCVSVAFGSSAPRCLHKKGNNESFNDVVYTRSSTSLMTQSLHVPKAREHEDRGRSGSAHDVGQPRPRSTSRPSVSRTRVTSSAPPRSSTPSTPARSWSRRQRPSSIAVSGISDEFDINNNNNSNYQRHNRARRTPAQVKADSEARRSRSAVNRESSRRPRSELESNLAENPRSESESTKDNNLEVRLRRERCDRVARRRRIEEIMARSLVIAEQKDGDKLANNNLLKANNECNVDSS